MFPQEHFSAVRSTNAIKEVFLQEHFFTFACSSAFGCVPPVSTRRV
jgi:hypothetical protein